MGSYREVELAASAARTTSGNGSAFGGFANSSKIAAQLVITAASGTNETLDVVIQHSIDGGTTWHDLISFAQQTAAATVFADYAEVEGATAQVYGDKLRAKWTIGGTDTPSFTFSVKISAEGDDY